MSSAGHASQELYPRILPSSFDPNDQSLHAINVPRAYTWQTLGTALTTFGSRVAIVRLPLYWQVLPLIYGACMQAPCTLFVNEKENSPLGEACLRVGGGDTVITDTRDAFAFALFCAERNTPVRNWFIVHSVSDSWDVPVMFDSEARVIQEVHSSPGVPVLVQCTDRAAARTGYHSVDVQIEGVPQFDIHTVATESGTCTCGRTIYMQK